jgi:nucleotide-binding universal stress UspA family protein
MFKHILVPTDLTEKSSRALEIAVKMAQYEVCAVTLLHVIEIIKDAGYEEFAGFYEKLRVRAEDKMEEMVKRYAGQKLVIDQKIAFGKRVQEIIGFAHENSVDLIVLSSHKIDSHGAVEGWGTISYRVGILSHCPVMMVK